MTCIALTYCVALQACTEAASAACFTRSASTDTSSVHRSLQPGAQHLTRLGGECQHRTVRSGHTALDQTGWECQHRTVRSELTTL